MTSEYKKPLMNRNAWHEFRREFPLLSLIPIIGTWAFGQYLRAYCDTKNFED